MLADEGRAIEAAYANHHARLERQLTSIVRDVDDGQDLTNEAFVRLVRVIAAGRPPDDPGAWLSRVGMNLAFSRGRHLGVVDRSLGLLPRHAEPVAPDAIAIWRETWREIGSLIDGLSALERQVLVLAAVGYRSAEIGVELGRSAGAVRSLLCRARTKLRLGLRSGDSAA